MRIKSCAIFLLAVAIIFLESSLSLAQSSAVTPVSGESWLMHLNRAFDETSMGKTGRLGPPTRMFEQPAEGAGWLQKENSQSISLSGADIYRLNCRGCHGEQGVGAPPEINSVINPVRASSVAATMARMKNAGMEISRADAVKLAEQSRMALLQRVHNGGQDMPAFPHLNQREVEFLLGYLRQLAEVPGAGESRVTVKEPRLRVGEFIVKSTCHICHGATGDNPTPVELSGGAIPPLSTLTSRTTRAELVRKVTQGAPIVMGEPALLYRGRMPVFYYLSEQEAGAVYDYLKAYPPRSATSNSLSFALMQSTDIPGDDPPPVKPASLARPSLSRATQSQLNAGIDLAIVLPVSCLLVLLVLGGAVGLTVREMKRLGREIPNDKISVNMADVRKARMDTHLVA